VDAEAPLAALAAFVPEIDNPNFKFGEWVPARRPAPGVVTMPYFAISPEGLALLAAMPVQMDFNWGEWKDTDEAKGLINDRDVLSQATEEQLVKLSTTLMRADRFTDGTLANAYASGLLAAIVRRAAVLSERPQNNGAT